MNSVEGGAQKRTYVTESGCLRWYSWQLRTWATAN